MLKPVPVIALAAVAVLGLLLWKPWERSALPRDASERADATAPAHDGSQQAVTREEAATSAPVAAPPKPAASIEPRSRPFALNPTSSIPHDARSGDPAAQLELARALDYCRRKYLFYFGRAPNHRTLDQGLALASSRGASVDEARQVHERCDQFMQGNTAWLGTADEWLKKAAAAGSYEARLLRAQRTLVRAEFEGVDDNGAALSRKEIEQQKAAAKEVLAEGLKRKDPAALWAIGDLQKDDKNSWVWFLAACKSGYDCSQGAEWYQSLCRSDYNCQPYETGSDLIRRINAGRYADLELLANELLKRIDAGEVSDLDLR